MTSGLRRLTPTSRRWTPLQSGAADALVIQNTYGMGYFGVESAFKLLAGQGSSVEKSSITTTRIITRDNMFAMDKQKALFPFG